MSNSYYITVKRPEQSPSKLVAQAHHDGKTIVSIYGSDRMLLEKTAEAAIDVHYERSCPERQPRRGDIVAQYHYKPKGA